ncbi:MAG: hypothetical protein RRC07_03950 [Anaerolineae bacterium]|nr:hypothetical protein [Anaerolineae bacterium]
MSMVNGYKVSYVVEDGSHNGAIIHVDHRPQIGQELRVDGAVFLVLEVEELIPPLDDFGFLHVTCRRVSDRR